MTIEFYLDYLCPKCYLQHKVLEDMVKEKKLIDSDIVYRNYEMVDHEHFDHTVSFIDFIATYKHLPTAEVIEFLKDRNLDITLFPIHHVHQMSHLAKKEGMSFIYNMAVFKAIYEDRIDLSDDHKLKALALDVGLTPEKIEKVLTSDLYSNAVISNKENALLKGVSDLPFIRVNRHIKLNGLSDEYDIIAALNSERLEKTEYCFNGDCKRHGKIN